jgi:putative acetyltransferase
VNVDIRRVRTLDDADVLALVSKSDEYLSALYPPESNHAQPLDALVARGSAFFAGYLGEQLAACGAVKFMSDDDTYGEIKRVFVAEEQRGKGLAVAIMQHLEDHLRSSGVYLARLEAGPAQPEALALYEKLGYRYRGPFGRYQPDPLSVFMEKPLAACD